MKTNKTYRQTIEQRHIRGVLQSIRYSLERQQHHIHLSNIDEKDELDGVCFVMHHGDIARDFKLETHWDSRGLWYCYSFRKGGDWCLLEKCYDFVQGIKTVMRYMRKLSTTH